MTTLDPETATALEREALRVHARYTEEFVEALNLCPWAQRSRKEGHTRTLVVLEASPDDAKTAALSAIDSLAADEGIEVGFVVFPRLALDRRTFETWVGSVRERDAEVHGGSPLMACAAFHPEADPDLSNAARLIPFMRRSPDRTIQAVRRSVLDAVRKPSDGGTGFVDPANIDLASMLSPAKRPLHERVADANLKTIVERGTEAAEAILRSICKDRDESYARILAKG